ncbi:hypothetical protein M2324_003872 [Rhodovulum sulfidophilum]|uniref:hypothetical protein n=1 Tax=Rhodovulum sulfidophilum TaxID=35806 RepID=UPI0012DA60E0|nr:hypothetical protein [Rhodovulum sulfidophilum]MBL3574291.1 hypothetical protein [Rhodovulum sulfidophilum]MCE8431979.1 hypothetical protein [Rhodovulum sulfidophilum]MCF4115656.1 hypothetical protein [Rhodovulum sulfidophilum]MCW2305447.1 hypothetical protein [Rhodovulum sulfidophilum]
MRLFALASFALALSACVEGTRYENAITAARASGQPLVITRVATSQPNSAGGVDVSIDGINTSNKTVKYLDYTLRAYNAVGDPVRGEIRRRNDASVRETGPIAPGGKTAPGVWSNMWYNYSITCARISSVTVIFMDNSSRKFTGQSINDLLAPGAYQRCN